MAFSSAAYAQPLSSATASDRVDYLKKVILLTACGLVVSGITGFMSAGLVYLVPILQTQVAMLVIIFGSYGIAHFVAPRMVFGGAKLIGFGVGAVFQGVAMGYLLLAAIVMSAMSFGNPFVLIGEAMLLTALTSVGMTVYLWSNPKEFKLIGGLLSALFVPMLILMAVSFVVPSWFGGTLGLLLCGAFVVISALGLLYQINSVLHKLSTNQHIEGAYMITMGILVLFWNILSLLMRLNRR